MQIVEALPPLSLSGNLPDLILSAATGEAITVKLYIGADLILDEIQRPDAAGLVNLELKKPITQLLQVIVPDFSFSVFNQKKSCVDFTLKLNSTSGQTSVQNFRVIKGWLDTDYSDINIFLTGNFLTWQPQAKHIQYYDPEWLTYYASDDCYLQIQAYCSPSKTTTIKTLANLPGGQLSTINLNYGLILALFAAEGIPVYYDVYIEKAGVRQTYVQRYILNQEEYEFNDVFVFENSLGGLDAIRFTGQATEKPNFEYDTAWFDEQKLNFEAAPDFTIDKNTGFFRTDDEKIWSIDFFGSLQQYKTQSGTLLRIYTIDPDLASIKGELTDYNFNYSFSTKNDAMNLCRTFEAPAELAIPDDVVGTIFNLAPKINHLPWATTKDVLFPVQYPYESEWRKLSLKEVISSIIIGQIGDNPGNDPEEPDGSLFGKWSDIVAKNAFISDEDVTIQFKTDFKGNTPQAITFLKGQFRIKPTFQGQDFLIGKLPNGHTPAKKIIKYFITANIEMFLTIDTNGEIKISSKDGFKLPTSNTIADYYFVNLFFQPGDPVQVNFNGKWVIDPSGSYCEPASNIYVWGKIFEENVRQVSIYTVADIVIKTFKGSATAPPADLSEPFPCTNPSIAVGYYDNAGDAPNLFNTNMNNELRKKLIAPNTASGNPAYPDQITYTNGPSFQFDSWYAFRDQAEGTWKLLQVVSKAGNTGKQINSKLMWVTDDADERPLDENNDLCIVSGKPQKTTPNLPTAANYKVLNLGACPIN